MNSYIPRGYVTTAEAVRRLFKARHADLAASAPAREAEMRQLHGPIGVLMSHPHPAARLSNQGGPNSEPEQPVGMFSKESFARLRELNRIASAASRLFTDAAAELRSALAEGDLVAVLNNEEMPLISKFRWRKNDGLTIVRESLLSHQVEGTHTQFLKSVVLIIEADLVEWLCSVLQTDPNKPGRGPSIEMSGTVNHSVLWRERVKAAGSTGKALIAWAKGKYVDEIPGREQLLTDHRAEFGTVRGINAKTIGAVIRPVLASLKSQKGGRPTQRLSASEK